MDANSKLTPSIVVVSTAPCNLFGAGTAHRRYLAVLEELGAKTYQVNGSWRFGTDAFPYLGGSCLASVQVKVDAYPMSDVIETFAVAERIVAIAQTWHLRGCRILLLGTYLYPFCFAIVHAAALLRDRGIRPGVILVPAGSDIWQIGHQLRETTYLLLSNSAVSARIAYSKQFANEINDLVGNRLPFWIIPPPIDVKHFRPCDASQKQRWRRNIGLDEQDFVLVNCSNMRPVKELGLTLTIAAAIAETTSRPITLLLVGPVTEHLVDRLQRWSGAFVGTDTPQEIRVGQLRVRVIGLQKDPRPYFWSSDLAINTSLHDSFNISLAESMACGLPILSTNVVGITEVPGVSDVGLFFPVNGDGLGPLRTKGQGFGISIDRSLLSITNWVTPILERDGRASSRSAAARAVVERELAIGIIRAQWSRLLDEVLDSLPRE